MDSVPSRFSMSWRAVAIISLVLAIASVAGLVIVASIHKASVLSTVALALAIVAFSSQLIIAIGQGHTETQQVRRAEEVSTRTLTSLGEIKTTTEGMLTTLREEYHTVLQHALSMTPEGDSDNVNAERLVPTIPEPSVESTIEPDEEGARDDSGESREE